MGIDETDGQGVDFFREAALGDRFQGIDVQRSVDRSGGGDPLRVPEEAALWKSRG